MVEEIQGTPASPGKAVGRAYKYYLNEEINVPDYEFILVCENTYPEMLPLISKAKGIVTYVGGLLSHPAIVAREFGIPCVLNVDIERIPEDCIIEVDGNKGIVRILNKV